MANFQTALDALKNGNRVARSCWRNGFLFLACGLDFYTTAKLDCVFKSDAGQCDGKTAPLWHYDCGPAWDREAICFCPRNKNHGKLSVGWLPKFDDLFADDWIVLKDEKATCKNINSENIEHVSDVKNRKEDVEETDKNVNYPLSHIVVKNIDGNELGIILTGILNHLING